MPDWITTDTTIAAATFVQAVALIATICVMVRTARRQLRAYLFTQNFTVMDGGQMAAGNQNPDVELEAPAAPLNNIPALIWFVKNSGQTPAYEVIHWAQVDVLEPTTLSSPLR